MTHEETKNFIRMIVSLYPNWKPADMADTILAWEFMVQEYSVKQMQLALKTYTKTNNSGFAPSVNQLISIINKPVEYSYMSEAEAWSIVERAISRGNYHAREDFDEFPDEIKRAVGSPTQLSRWASDNDYNGSVVMSNFQRSYRAVVNQSKEFAVMPKEMRSLIEEAVNGSKMLEGKEKAKLLTGE